MAKYLIRFGLVVALMGLGVLDARAETVKDVLAGYLHTCALTTGGRVLCWGGNEDGELGDGTTTNRLTPGQVSGLESGVTALTIGTRHTCALTTAGAVWCWGDNEVGQLGDGTTTNRLTPVPVSGLGSGVAAIAAGGWHTCALTDVGGMVCWGLNINGELGDGTRTDRWTPTPVSGLDSGVAAMTGGTLHTCALTTGGGVLCWGDNSDGQLGDGTTTTRPTPGPVSGLAGGIAVIAAGGYHTCAVTTGGGALCWGYNEFGQIGDGTFVDRSTPTGVSGLGNGVATITGGWAHTCALTTDARMLCWGDNFFGEIGDGTTGDSPATPTPVSGLGNVVAGISAGWEYTCAVTTGGGVLSWGLNDYGQIGDGTTTNRPTPTAVTTGFEGPLPRLVPVDLNGAGISNVAVFRSSTAQWWIYGQASAVTFGQAGDIPVVADYNGDGRADLAVYRPSTSEWIIKDQRTTTFGQPGDVPVPGDYNGDGKAEIAVFRPSTGEWLIEGAGAPVAWGARGDIPVPADYNGDGTTEIAVFRPTTGTWYVMGGATLQWGMWGDVPVPGDYNGDGKAEIAIYRPSTGWWYVAGGAMSAWGAPGDLPVPLDVDGDGALEFVVFRPSTGMWYVLDPVTSETSAIAQGQAGDTPVGQPPQLPQAPLLKTAGDFDQDGAADITIFRPSTGGWYTLTSTSAYHDPLTVTLGQTGDVPVPGDYQGTGRQERAVYRPSTGQWLLEDGRTFTLGAPGDVPVPGDYDGDGIMDVAVFTPGSGLWSILTGASGFTTLVTEQWGASGDVPAPGDYDGDGKTDVAVLTPTTGVWSVRSSLSGTTLVTVPFGMSGDVPVPGDYDGDGKTDIAVYRPSTGFWYVLTSSSSWSSYQSYWWGAVDDVPVPGDYDGDGRTDIAVYRPSTGTWYVMDVMTIVGWGNATDIPILSR